MLENEKLSEFLTSTTIQALLVLCKPGKSKYDVDLKFYRTQTCLSKLRLPFEPKYIDGDCTKNVELN